MFFEARDIHTYYGTSHVLRGISLRVNARETVGLLGRNGMGKSTTLKSIMGLARVASGAVVYKSKDLAGYPPFKVARAGIGFVPEERRVFPYLTVRENLSLGIKGKRPAVTGDGDGWTMTRVLEHFPLLEERLNHKGAHLSGGEQKMLALGRALMGDPELLLVDEPTEGLAPLIIEEIKGVLKEIKQAGVSILLVEHNLEVALDLAARVYLMGKGRIEFSGTVQELEAQPEVVEKYLGV